MGYQFVHLESYARKADNKGRSTDFIFAEADRQPEASVHVQNPRPPVVVYGLGIEAMHELHDTAAAAATITVKGGHVRKVARDKKTLHTVVASYPHRMDEIRGDPGKRKAAEDWEKLTVSWLRSQYGDDLKSVIRHEDEEYFHIHAYVVPTGDPAMSAIKYHPGTMAKREVMDRGCAEGEDTKALSKRADAAYKSAMRAWQDSYHDAVAVPSGLTRLGPQRRRLSREEWKREQVQAKALQKTVERAKTLKASGEKFVMRTKNEAATITSAATREKEVAAKATVAAIALREQAQRDQVKALDMIAEANRYRGFGGRLRALWDGLRKSKLIEKIRDEFSNELDRVRGIAEKERVRVREEERRRRDAEQRAHEAERQAEQARDDAARASIERDRLLSILKPRFDHDAREPAPAVGPELAMKPPRKDERKRQ